MSSIGGGNNNPLQNNGRLFMRLKPRAERNLTADQIIEQLRPKLEAIPGVRVYLQNPPLISIGGMQSKALYQFSLQATDTELLYHWAPKLQAAIEKLPEFKDVGSDLQIANPQITVEIDRDRASALGVTPDQIEDALFSAYGQRQISTIYTDVNE